MSRKMRDIYLVDGYNLLNFWGSTAEKQPLDAGQADAKEAVPFADRRSDLLLKLDEYAAYEGYDLIIVFDAPHTEEGERREKVSDHLSVIFTGGGVVADSVIERLSYELKGKGAVYVVTSDAAEQSVALGAGAYRIPCREFIKRIRRAKKKLKRDYLTTVTLPLVRNEIGSHLDEKAAAKLDELRRL